MKAYAEPPLLTVPVREGESLDPVRLLEYLRRVAGVPSSELEIRQFPTGASNLTYWIRVGDWVGVLRRPPPGPLPARAHDMVREGHLLRHLHPVFPLAPRPFAVCDDPAVIGAPFHVMEYRAGVVIDASFPPDVAATPANCRTIAFAAVETLAALHDVDHRAAGLSDLGRPDGFLERQVLGWIDRYASARTDDIAEAAPLTARLRDTVPLSPPPALIHNDFKPNNLLFDPRTLEVTAVLDWEMATIGDPILDLAIFLSYCAGPTDPPELRALLPSVTALDGFPQRAELAATYARRTGRDLDHLDWYLTFASFKLAVILQQIYARWIRGQTGDPRFARFGDAVRTLIRHAHTIAP